MLQTRKIVLDFMRWSLAQDWEESQHPRGQPDNAGQFVEKDAAKKPNEKVVNVGGDDWNKQTAKRLEDEYVKVYPQLEELEKKVYEGSVPVAKKQVWADLPSYTQENVETTWKENNKTAYEDSEVNYWYENDAADEAAQKVLYDFKGNNKETEWAENAIGEWLDENENVPFTKENLTDALDLSVDYGEDVKIDFKDDVLEPTNFDPNQETLPGIEPLKPSDYLTHEMRDKLESVIHKAWKDRVLEVQQDLEPPEHIKENAEESLNQAWSSMEDEQKFQYGVEEGEINEEEGQEEETEPPAHFDPLQEHVKGTVSRKEYAQTQAFARKMQTARSVELVKERGLDDGVKDDDELATWVAATNHTLWEDWKESSTSDYGKLLQVAIAEELGGRLRGYMQKERQDIISEANTDGNFHKIGGFDGVKALVRATWETTQMMLDKADIQTVDLYRCIRRTNEKGEKIPIGETKERRIPRGAYSLETSYAYLPELSLRKNGAASASLDSGVVNAWDGDDRIVMRATVPRTAVVSVPAYGINLAEEREVVIAGTAWDKWDAWYHRAPMFSEVKVGE